MPAWLLGCNTWTDYKLSHCFHHECNELQVIVVNYEDSHTTMEAPDEDDESSYT